jgi:hypothetical protein
MKRYRSTQAEKREYGISGRCRVLEVSRAAS